jgi:hypothetical protein
MTQVHHRVSEHTSGVQQRTINCSHKGKRLLKIPMEIDERIEPLVVAGSLERSIDHIIKLLQPVELYISRLSGSERI